MMADGLVLFTRIDRQRQRHRVRDDPGAAHGGRNRMSIVASTIAATQGARRGQDGLAWGLANTSRHIGGGLGFAPLITSVPQSPRT